MRKIKKWIEEKMEEKMGIMKDDKWLYIALFMIITILKGDVEMYIHSIEKEDDFITLTVRGSEKEREEFHGYISCIYSPTTEKTVKELGMLMLTFDYIAREQTMAMVKRATLDFIEEQKSEVDRSNLERLK